jgi:hypothetical protein
MDLFGWEGDPSPGRRKRRKGMKKVSKGSPLWWEMALRAVHGLPTDWTGKGEDIRFRLVASLGHPHHQNIYGALIYQCERRGWLEKTGEQKQMRGDKSHARSTAVLRRTIVR